MSKLRYTVFLSPQALATATAYAEKNGVSVSVAVDAIVALYTDGQPAEPTIVAPVVTPVVKVQELTPTPEPVNLAPDMGSHRMAPIQRHGIEWDRQTMRRATPLEIAQARLKRAGITIDDDIPTQIRKLAALRD